MSKTYILFQTGTFHLNTKSLLLYSSTTSSLSVQLFVCLFICLFMVEEVEPRAAASDLCPQSLFLEFCFPLISLCFPASLYALRFFGVAVTWAFGKKTCFSVFTDYTQEDIHPLAQLMILGSLISFEYTNK